METLKILFVGGGAVGSHATKQIREHSKLGPDRVKAVIVDNQRYEAKNEEKTADVIQFPEDTDRWKAEALAARLREKGMEAVSFVGSVELLGPLALSCFDYVICGPDSIAVREYTNRLWRECPKGSRPRLLIAGTVGDDAQLEYFTPEAESCYRCNHAETSFRKLIGVKTSCSDVAVLHKPDEDTAIHAGVTPEAGKRAGSMIAEMLVSDESGRVSDQSMFLRWRPSMYALPIQGYPIPHREDCPDCRIRPPENVRLIEGDCLSLTLRQFLGEVAESLHTKDFFVETHLHRFDEGEYSEFLIQSFCHSCGEPIMVCGHTGRISTADLFCPVCRTAGKTEMLVTEGLHKEIYAFLLGSDPMLMEKNLMELGYPIGSYYRIQTRTPAKNRYCFSLRGDCKLLESNLNFMEV